MEKSGTVATVGAFSPLIGDRILVHGWDSCDEGPRRRSCSIYLVRRWSTWWFPSVLG